MPTSDALDMSSGNLFPHSSVIETDMSERHFMQNEKIRKSVLRMHPIGRFGSAEEIADAVLWMVSPGASFVTGHALVIDGGVTA